MTANGVKLPLVSQSSTSPETRYEKGLETIESIFGKGMVSEDAVPENQKHIQRYLAANCFGDYQTRSGLDMKMREMLTFSILISLGGCEAQVKGHIQWKYGSREWQGYAVGVVTQLLPLQRLSTNA